MHIGKISGRKIYTAQELLKMNPIEGKLARDIEKLEKRYEKMYGNKKQKKTVKVNTVIKELEKIPKISIEKKRNEYFVKSKDNTICRIADRKYGVSIGIRKDGKYTTVKIKNEKELDDGIKEIKEQIK